MNQPITDVPTNEQVPINNDLPQVPFETFTKGFLDTGIMVKVPLPLIVNTDRVAIPGDLTQNNTSILSTNRQPLFGIRLDPFLNHDLNGRFSPLVFPDPIWAANNVAIKARPYGHEHPFVRQMPTFTGWRGSIDLMISINSSAIVQGELSFITGKYYGAGPYTAQFPQLEYDEPANNHIVTLTTERRVVKAHCYNEMANFINLVHDMQARYTTPPRPQLTPYRNYLFIRPNTDITTMLAGDSTLTFKIFMQPGPDFEWLFPSIPITFDLPRNVSVVDRDWPFVLRGQLIIQQRRIGSIRQLQVYDTWMRTLTTFSIGVTRVVVDPIPFSLVGVASTFFMDISKFVPSSAPQWTEINGYSFGYVVGSDNFSVNIIIEGVETSLGPILDTELVYQQVVLEFGCNPGSTSSDIPPYFLP